MNMETIRSFAMGIGLAVGYTAAYRGLIGLIGRALELALRARDGIRHHGRFRHA